MIRAHVPLQDLQVMPSTDFLNLLPHRPSVDTQKRPLMDT